MTAFIDVVFDGPPGPEAGRFVEVEDDAGRSVHVGEWVRDGGHWRLRIYPHAAFGDCFDEPEWIGVDLDSTIANYTGFVSNTNIGAPIPAMVQRVKAWLSEGRRVKIFTARVGGDGKRGSSAAARAAIEAWCVEHIGVALEVTNVKDYRMLELYDDRCVQVEPNTGRLLGRSTRGYS